MSCNLDLWFESLGNPLGWLNDSNMQNPGTDQANQGKTKVQISRPELICTLDFPRFLWPVTWICGLKPSKILLGWLLASFWWQSSLASEKLLKGFGEPCVRPGQYLSVAKPNFDD